MSFCGEHGDKDRCRSCQALGVCGDCCSCEYARERRLAAMASLRAERDEAVVRVTTLRAELGLLSGGKSLKRVLTDRVQKTMARRRLRAKAKTLSVRAAQQQEELAQLRSELVEAKALIEDMGAEIAALKSRVTRKGSMDEES